MGADLQYAKEDLETLGSELKTLASDIEGDGRLGDVAVDQVAHSIVAEALRNFADDWDDKRKALATNLDNISSLATQAADCFGQADDELAREIRDVVEGGQ